jgi:serine/threonine protein kinase
MIGGKLLSEGGYGCVFYPEIPCKKGEQISEKYASKIQVYDKSAKKEISIGKKVETIPGFKNHFAPVLKHCFVNVSEINAEDKGNCSVLQRSTDNRFILLKMSYIDGPNFISFMVNNRNSRQIINNVINSYNHLLTSLRLLISQKIVHYDIKGDNILFNLTLQAPTLIDFGLSMDIEDLNDKTLKKYFYIYAPDYYIWPLEVHYLCFLLHKNENPNIIDIQMLCKTYIKNNIAIQKNFSPNFIKQYEKICMKQMLVYKNMGSDKAKSEILSLWKYWDNYSVSVLFLKFISYFSIEGYVDNPFIVFLSELLLNNIHPNPKNRLSVENTIQTFNSFLLTSEINKESTFDELTGIFVENRKEISINLQRDQKKDRFLTKSIGRE